MKKLLTLLLVIVYTHSFSQINNFEEEGQFLHALQQLVAQSFTEHYAETDWDEGTRQFLEFDPMSMNLVFYKTPYDEDDNGKLSTSIQWLAKSVIPLYEIDTLIGDNKKNTITIKTKGQSNKYDIQTYAIKSGGEYYPAAQGNELIVQSDKLLKIRNLEKRLNWHISELQKFYKKKMDLVNYLNKKLKQEIEYQIKDSLNYRSDKKFKVLQEFQLDNSGQWLSVIVERRNIYDNPITEKQSLQLRDVLKIGKNITVMLVSKPHNVLKTTTVKNEEEERKIETVDDWFYLHFSHEKDNEKLGDEIINLFKQIGMEIQKSDWFD
ncbi:MAG: hypothetical protein AMXMBFR79_18130 [Chitinophagaceae bacterium]